MTTLQTRRVTLSARKIAHEGPRYWDDFVGLRVVWTSWEGEEQVGTVESFVNPVDGSSGFPILRFADGKWARGDHDLQVVLPDVHEHAEKAKAEVRSLIADGTIDAEAVFGYAELHDFVDANTLGGVCDDETRVAFGPDGYEAWIAWGSEVQDEVHAWLSRDGHRRATAGKA